MARFAVGVMFGVVVGTVLGAAAGLHADEPTVAEAAAMAQVDPQDLAGAVATTGLPPFEYLRAVGELPGPPSASSSPAAPTSGVWARLAHCESTDNWRANTGNGYFGGLQQDMTFWRNYGGLAYAPRPDLASPAAQIIVAERGRARQGFGAWPACSRQLGLR